MCFCATASVLRPLMSMHCCVTFLGDLCDRLSRKYCAVPFFTKANLDIQMKSATISSVPVFYTETMFQSKKRIHIFNCDNTYKLEPVEKLLEETKKKFPEKFKSIHVKPVERHSFRLTQMSEMVDKIPTLEMDMAFFVVHANESRLSINEDNAGIGYTRIYRALLQATGKKGKYLTQSHFFERISLLLITHFSASWTIFEKGSGELVQIFSIFLKQQHIRHQRESESKQA